jgi:hypothetical protein
VKPVLVDDHERRIAQSVRGPRDSRAGGADGATWMIDYDLDRTSDDEAGYCFDEHRFAPGEYVTIQDEDEKASYVPGVAMKSATWPENKA